MTTHALIATGDEILSEELLRRAAAAGAEPTVVQSAQPTMRNWSSAAVVLLGSDLVDQLAALAPPRRAGVHVISWGSTPDSAFRPAIAVGAESVIDLPHGGEWITEMLTDLADERVGSGRLIGVIGGSGGAGATTFACALAQVAARVDDTLIIDADPLGPGLDRVLGTEELPGVRWHELGHVAGRLSARALRESLPRQHHLAVLTWSAGQPSVLDPAILKEIASAGVRGHHLVVVDLPRVHGDHGADLISRCDQVLIIARASVTGVASAARTARTWKA